MDDRERLEAIVKVVRQYLPPDGISIKEAMGKIIELVDPLPLKREWVGLTDADIAKAMHGSVEGSNVLPYQFARAIEQALKEKNANGQVSCT